jgi:uncharacterized membrane protein YeaQ/YmgE (transglycosylase-associated protein family)
MDVPYAKNMNILSWLLFGLLVGMIANALDPQPGRGGLVGSMLLGIAGAFVGGLFANVLFGYSTTGFNLPAFIVATAGSLLLLFLGRGIKRV